MFPITHIWFSRRVLGYVNNLTVLGSVFPDTVIKCSLTYDQTHNAGWGLYERFRDHSEEYLDFARAAVTHTVNPKGLDFYGDEEYGSGYKGYCFQKAVEIEKEVISACNIPDKFGLWKAHNFIEMGIEMNIADSENELVSILHKGLTDNYLINELSTRIDKYFGLKERSAADCFSKFTEFMELQELSSLALANRYNAQMQVKHGIKIDISRCSDIIEKSRTIVREDFESFIDYCTEKVETMLKEEHA
ncbi:MAG TPA: hypothetical protein VEB00_03420 [Clostridia bacterium]|nr:hypothetical protein [Clostridia bacterium]